MNLIICHVFFSVTSHPFGRKVIVMLGIHKIRGLIPKEKQVAKKYKIRKINMRP